MNFSTDNLSEKLKKANPSLLKDKPLKFRQTEILTNVESALPDISSKVTTAVGNFKNLKTGALPEVNIPKIDTNAFFNEIDLDTKLSIKSFSGVKDKINAEQILKKQNITTDIAAVTANNLKGDEVAKLQGDMFKNIKTGIGTIDNTDLRNFNLSAGAQTAFENNLSTDIIAKGKDFALSGKSDIEDVSSQLKSISNFDSLV